MARQYWLSIRGNQRAEIDEDLLAQALLMVAQDLSAQQNHHDHDMSVADEDGQLLPRRPAGDIDSQDADTAAVPPVMGRD